MANDVKEGMRNCTFPLFIAFLFFSVFFPHFTASGQKPGKYYTASLLDKGTLYFIFPFGDFQETSTKSHLIFDISYLSSRDSATVNFSYFYSSASPAKSLTFRFGENTVTCPAAKLFMDVENHQKWHHRFTATIAFSDLSLFFRSEFPPSLIINTSDSDLTYVVGKHEWKKHGEIVSTIIQIIQANK